MTLRHQKERLVAFKVTQVDQLNLAHLDYSKTIVLSSDASVLGVEGCV